MATAWGSKNAMMWVTLHDGTRMLKLLFSHIAYMDRTATAITNLSLTSLPPPPTSDADVDNTETKEE